ncbi:MAG: V-type ATP synthase subunit D [Desulfuromonadales bacterium]|nr:V-type ATP synthase subunit D [Desulfuromonadales bacterium]
MLHPTRTNLLLLKERHQTVWDSISILKGRRQALIREFLAATRPLLRSRESLRAKYAEALERLRLSLGHEGEEMIAALAAVNRQDPGLEIIPRNILGLHYLDLTVHQTPLRTPVERGHDFRGTSPHIEETELLFETIAAEMLETATYEAKVKRLEEELHRLSRRIRVLEERTIPGLSANIRSIVQALGEREREAYFRLKRFKQSASRTAASLTK